MKNCDVDKKCCNKNIESDGIKEAPVKKEKKQVSTKNQQKRNKLLAYGFSKDLAQDVPEEVKKIDKLKNEWIPFGDDNLFPQHLSELSRAASTHRAILNTKTTFTIGGGFSYE